MPRPRLAGTGTARRLLARATALALVAAGACRTTPVSPEAREVQRFVSGQRLPQVKDTREVLRVPEQQISIFVVRYGEPQDCPSGCIYLVAAGLRYGNRVGWMTVQDRPETPVDTARLAYFDVTAADEYLFGDELPGRLGESGLSGYARRALLVMLVRDPDTPAPVRERARARLRDG